MSACPKPMSNSEARRLIKAGAVEINGVKVTDPHAMIPIGEGEEVIVRVGKLTWCKFIGMRVKKRRCRRQSTWVTARRRVFSRSPFSQRRYGEP